MIRLYLLLALSIVSFQSAAEIRIRDIADREVVLPATAKHVLLGEGRFLSVFGVLGIEEPLPYVAGMMNEFKLFDPAGYARYRQAFPEIEQVPTYGITSEQSVSVEKILMLNPDVAVFGLAGHGPGARSRHIIDKIEAAGIPVVFIDFRLEPVRNSVRSMQILGKVLGREAAADAYAERYQQTLQTIRERVAHLPDDKRTSALFDVRVDMSNECCFSIAEGLFVEMAELAGGNSIATGILPGPVGNLSREYIANAAFDVYIGTAIGSPASQQDGLYSHLVLGPEVTPDMARASLKSILEQRDLIAMPAVEEGRAYALWHHFYNSPLNLYAIEVIAKWLHPDLFADLKPEATLDMLLKGTGPVDLTGTYSISIH